MSFNLERTAMRGKLAEAQERRRRLVLRIEGNAAAIRQGLNTALTPVADMDVPQLAEQMDELVQAWGELQGTLGEIARLEKELR
ncbi:MAG: hypothetical protein IH614_13600 [Desulfuromonadales bacterium]|nr:hypothetical protein [Desulfuromonadales bacterium]